MRHQARPQDPNSHVRLRGGHSGLLVDVSSLGALVEGDVRLLPGSHLDVQVVTSHGRAIVRCRVVRAFVVNLLADRVVYRSALRFDHAVDLQAGG
jgi:hypothetical protein